MKTTLQPKECRTAIRFVTGIVPNKTTLPILSTVHCHAKGDLELTATDLDTTLIARCDSRTTKQGAFTIPKRALMDIGASKQEVDIELDDKLVAHCRTGGNVRSIPTLSFEEFPPTPNEVKTQNIRVLKLDVERFMSALRSVSIASSTDQARYILNGVFVEIGVDTIRLVGTDGRRLHMVDMPRNNPDVVLKAQIERAEVVLLEKKDLLADAERDFPSAADAIKTTPEVDFARSKLDEAKQILWDTRRGSSILIPTGTVNHILRIPVDKKAIEELVITSYGIPSADKQNPGVAGWVRLNYGKYTIISKQIDGNYPNYRQVIPEDCKERICIMVSELAEAVKVAEKATSEKSNSVKLTFSKNNLAVVGHTPEIGESRASVAINYKGKEFAIAFNPGYLLDICTAFKDSPEMFCEFIDELSPGVFVNNSGLKAVVMPMRLS